MKIRFTSSKYRTKRASHRLRGEVTCRALVDQGYDAKILTDWNEVDANTIVIFLKLSQPDSIQRAKDLGAKTIYDLCDNKFEEKEVGVTVVNNKATVLSYNLTTKWCQIAYLAPNETAILRKMFARSDFNAKFLLTFEIINKIIEMGGSFTCYDIENSYIKEIDSLKDINNEITS